MRKVIFKLYIHERLDFLFCTACIVRLHNIGWAEIGKFVTVSSGLCIYCKVRKKT